MEQPLVSVLMTAYNRGKYIADAIESVLASSYKNFELIIVDDCSKDNTVTIARSYAENDNRVKVYVNETNLTDYVNRNKAASYASGKYIKYVDSDDLIYYYTLDVMVNFMERFPDAGFGLCGAPVNIAPLPQQLSPRDIYFTNFNGMGHFDRGPLCSIIKLDAFNKVGHFSGARFYGDTELWLNLARYYPMVMLPGDLFFYRTHEASEAKMEKKQAKKIDKDRHDLLMNSLLHKDCPLTKAEVTKIIEKQKSNYKRNLLFGFLQRLKRAFFISA
jgi:glycosyltransferase involved in cell wall biosynthesis